MSLDELKEYREWQERHALNLGDRWQGDEYGLCFPAMEGNPMHPTFVNTWLNVFAEKHSLPHINPHAFRHTQASLLCFGGMDMVSKNVTYAIDNPSRIGYNANGQKCGFRIFEL